MRDSPAGPPPMRRVLFPSLAVFAVTAAIGTWIVAQDQRLDRGERLRATDAAARSVADGVEQQISGATGAAGALAAVVRQTGGVVDDFEQVAADLLAVYPSIESLRLAPGGVIRHVYPHSSQAAVGVDLARDPVHAPHVARTIETRQITVAGPFPLRQGGEGLAARAAVFTPGPGGDELWGVVTAVFTLDRLVEASRLRRLAASGYDYELSRGSPDGGGREVFLRSGPTPLRDPVVVQVNLPGAPWTLAVSPRGAGTLPTPHVLQYLLVLGASLAAASLAARALRQPALLARLVEERTAALDRASREREALLGGIPDPAWLKDTSGRFVAVNEALAQLARKPLDEILGRRHGEVFGATGTPEIDANDARALAGRDVVAEETVRSTAGEHIVFEVIKRPYRDAGGSIVGTVGIARDATVRHRAERALQDSERRLRLIIDRVPAFVAVLSADGAVAEANRAALSAVGRPREVVIGRRLADHLDWIEAGSRQRVAAGIERGARGEPVRFAGVRLLPPDGGAATCDFDATPIPGEGASAGELVLSGIDVTERARAEERIREAHLGLTALVEASPLAMLQLDRSYVVTTWNTPAERVFQWTAGEAVGRRIEVVPEADFDEFRATIDGVFATGVPVSGLPRKRQRKDGSLVDVQISAAPVRDTAGGVREVVVYYVDVTEHRRLEEALRQSQKMEAIGQLAGGVAHDFNNLLTIIDSHLQFMEECIAAGSPLADDLQQVKAASARAASLTRQLLAFSRRQVMRPRVVDVNAVVAEIVKMLHRLIGEDVVLRIEPGAELWRVRADPGQLEQVLFNLAVNARDAMPGGGTLTIRTRNVTRDGATAGAGGREHVLLEVADTGVGMDAATRARAFEPFFTTKEVGKGTGLGLATVYGIVTQSGGSLECDTAPGRGTTIQILLPRTADEPERPAAPGRGPCPPDRGQRVMLVEDDDAVRGVTARALRHLGYTVHEARGGVEALAMVEGGTPVDLLVTDLVMPAMSGSELVARLRAGGRELAVLLVSGYTEDEFVRRGALPAGVSFLPKPFSAAELAEKVRQVLAA